MRETKLNFPWKLYATLISYKWLKFTSTIDFNVATFTRVHIYSAKQENSFFRMFYVFIIICSYLFFFYFAIYDL